MEDVGTSVGHHDENEADNTHYHPTKGWRGGPKAPQTVSVPEAARMLGIGRNAAYDSVKRGELPALKFGKRLVVPMAALERMLNAGPPKAA